MASPVIVTVSWVFAWLVTLIALVSLGRGIAHLVRQFSQGQPDHTRMRPVGKRLWTMLSTIITHREFTNKPVVKVAHWFVMVSFPLLFLTLISGYAHLRDPRWSLPLIGTWAPWQWLVDIFAWAGLLAIIVLMVIRYRTGHRPEPLPADATLRKRTSRFFGSTRWQALFVEWVIVIVCGCVVVLRGLEAALVVADGGDASWWHYPLTGWIGSLVSSAAPSTLATAIVLVSLLKILVSMLWMIVIGVQTSMGVAWHRFLAIINLYARRNADGAKSLGPAAPMLVDGEPLTDLDRLDDLPDDVPLGVGTALDLTWKQRLDLYSCTECGRCQELCPAWNTEKPLSPKLLVLALRDHVESVSRVELTDMDVPEEIDPGEDKTLIEKGVLPSPHTSDVLHALSSSGATGPLGVRDTDGPLVPDVIDEGVLWDCTMCGACVDQCPVDIEHVDDILNLRRHRVLMESAFPRDLARPFRGMEMKGNPYNQSARKRMEWAKNLDFDVPVIGEDIDSADDVEYVLWVGCAGAYDDRAKKTTAALAELLHTAGVTFGVLGSAESCTGDPARRAGNEILFQMLASAAIDTLNEAHARKIVVTCAHCFNTIAGEFPQLGGTFEVIHHTQLLNRLVRENRLTPLPPAPGEQHQTITYHDPCFLGRHNRIFEAPRDLLGSLPSVDMVEMPRNRERALCCGAGGARAWMEETRGTRIADNRMDEARETGAHVVATACPYCSQMLGSAHGENMPEVKDVAVLLLEGVHRHRDAAGDDGAIS